MPPSDDEFASLFKLLAAPARVRIVRLLRNRALCVGALSKRLDITQGAVSQHLRALRDGGLVTADKRGNFVHYRLNGKTVEQFRRVLDNVF